MARSLNCVGSGKSGDRRSRYSVGLLILSSRQTDITWVGQTSYVLPNAPGAAFTIEWGYSMSNRNLSYITPSVAIPWPSQQRLISGAQLFWQP